MDPISLVITILLTAGFSIGLTVAVMQTLILKTVREVQCPECNRRNCKVDWYKGREDQMTSQEKIRELRQFFSQNLSGGGNEDYWCPGDEIIYEGFDWLLTEIYGPHKATWRGPRVGPWDESNELLEIERDYIHGDSRSDAERFLTYQNWKKYYENDPSIGRYYREYYEGEDEDE